MSVTRTVGASPDAESAFNASTDPSYVRSPYTSSQPVDSVAGVLGRNQRK